MLRKNPNIQYHPSYWLAALGAGGTSVSFFMYLMWLIPHPATPIPTYADWHTQLIKGDLLAAITLFALIGVIIFALLHVLLLIWNIAESRQHKAALQTLDNTPAELQKMAIPLTLAMTVNVFFILGALFVPGLWSVVEYLFPGAIFAFAIIAYVASQQFTRYMSHMISDGGYRSQEHNHLSGLISVFTFAMLAVGFAAAAAMSHVAATVAIATSFSLAFMIFAILLGILFLVKGITAMMQHGLSEPASPSIWMLIPILTLLAITWVRLSHGLSHHFKVESHAGQLFVPLSLLFTLQIGVLALGYKVMKKNGYLTYYLHGDKESPVSFGLICPGVALFVMGMFWWHIGWVKTGIIDQFSAIYWLGIVVLLSVQIITILSLIKLTKKLLMHPLRQPLAQA
ncbi:TsoY family (seleno)protein [Marinomonas aquiplantarum]|uniref:Uncharacterized protein n=1 Tax=Marinomonas aquiplantarum TaxID=491951 RepID=A0A366CVA6_9GAMM|nr:hypothetical protein [Marinomonas aquiplantarum]RBO80049.1 hypothetical protein DFP76_109102 [Marinomonas aquiplantarum]